MTPSSPQSRKLLSLEEVELLAQKIGELQGSYRISQKGLSCLLETARAALKVVEAAKGLICGVDWNNGTHAITHGYREKLIESLSPFREGEKT